MAIENERLSEEELSEVVRRERTIDENHLRELCREVIELRRWKAAALVERLCENGCIGPGVRDGMFELLGYGPVL